MTSLSRAPKPHPRAAAAPFRGDTDRSVAVPQPQSGLQQIWGEAATPTLTIPFKEPLFLRDT